MILQAKLNIQGKTKKTLNPMEFFFSSLQFLKNVVVGFNFKYFSSSQQTFHATRLHLKICFRFRFICFVRSSNERNEYTYRSPTTHCLRIGCQDLRVTPLNTNSILFQAHHSLLKTYQYGFAQPYTSRRLFFTIHSLTIL